MISRYTVAKQFIVQLLLALLIGYTPALVWAQATVVAASDLQFALEDLRRNFERESGHQLKLIYGSSGNFYAQIQQGAPFELFLSADEDFVFKLADAGKTMDRGQLYAVGRIGLFVPHDSVLKADPELKDLSAALKDGRLKKLAIANPEHAPYGARAREALQYAGLWTDIQPKLVLGENISQATQFATSGSTQGGITAQSLALAPALARRGSFALIPQSWHQPLKQRMVLIKGSSVSAQAFYRYLGSAAAKDVLSRYGFSLPSIQ